MQDKQKTALVWFRNDLRVLDNNSLNEAASAANRLIAVYCFDPRHFELTTYGFRKTEKFRTRFLIESVSELRKSLKQLNISLIISINPPEIVLPKLAVKHKIITIYSQKEWTQEEREVTENVRNSLPHYCSIEESYDQFLYHPDDCPIPFDSIPKIFTSFRKTCEKLTKVRPEQPIIPKAYGPENLITEDSMIPDLKSLGYTPFKTDTRSAFPYQGGEKIALNRLEDYFFNSKKLGYYKKTRNGLVGVDYSSKFSPWLAHGCISARTIYWAVKRFEQKHYKNQSTYWLIFELIWRDFFKYISLKHGDKIFKIGGILDKEYTWDTSLERFNKWANGQTPEPFVNANMIELNETGWMSNRGRQNVASYLSRNMNIDWRMGAAYFESLLIDYDVHSNYGNWMYVSGVGNDPRDRKFNVRLQADRYDPQSKFRNLWLQRTLFK